MREIVDRFATSPERRAIVEGFLDYRAVLVSAGLSGVQWIDGSFVEDIERSDDRAPRDIDVVTFYDPASIDSTKSTELQEVGSPAFAKAKYMVDGYFCDGTAPMDRLLSDATYWSSQWGHRRDNAWKGFLAVALPGATDDEARAVLAEMGEAHA